MKLLSWNTAFGSPYRRRGREEEVRNWLSEGAHDVDLLLLQEAIPTLLDGLADWSVQHAVPNGPHGSCVLVACRRPARLDPVDVGAPSRDPEGKRYCLTAADLHADVHRIRCLSMYVPWRSSSKSWMQQIAPASVSWPMPAVIGADMNSPVGARAKSHGFIEAAAASGWRHATPLHVHGPTFRKSHIDHVLLRGLTSTAWSLDRSVLAEGLSDHAATFVEAEIDEVTDALEVIDAASGRVLGSAQLLPDGQVLVDEGARAYAEQAGVTGEPVWQRLCRLGNGYVTVRRADPTDVD
jgi:endonuclease/exonuclease/phosphatase family metal-dependent hydrolase